MCVGEWVGGWICVYVCVVRACEYEGFLTAMISEEESISVDTSPRKARHLCTYSDTPIATHTLPLVSPT